MEERNNLPTGECDGQHAFNRMQTVKRQFFAYRNGIIADTLRRAGSPFKIIFGLNLPQIKNIAQEIGTDRELAERLWGNRTTRESLLMAPMIFPADELTLADALDMCRQTDVVEIADGLCHSLLRKTNMVGELIGTLSGSERDMDRYVALRLAWNLLPGDIDKVEKLIAAESVRNCALTRPVVRRLADEIEFLKE